MAILMRWSDRLLVVLPYRMNSVKTDENPKMWLGPESNRRHADFQSAALPTELPSREDVDLFAEASGHYATNRL